MTVLWNITYFINMMYFRLWRHWRGRAHTSFQASSLVSWSGCWLDPGSMDCTKVTTVPANRALREDNLACGEQDAGPRVSSYSSTFWPHTCHPIIFCWLWTRFSVMKLVKTDWRARLKAETLCDLLTVQLNSPDIMHFDPSNAIEVWHADSLRSRRPEFTRKDQAEKQQFHRGL